MRLSSTKQMRNLVCGRDFILGNDDDNQIRSWLINLGQHGFDSFNEIYTVIEGQRDDILIQCIDREH